MKRSVVKAWLLATSVAVLIGGCGGAEEEDSKGSVPMGKVPAGVLNVARAKHPGMVFDAAIQEKSGGRVSYELTGHDAKGKVEKVRVAIARDGKVLEGG